MNSVGVSNPIPGAHFLAQRSQKKGGKFPISGPGVWVAVVPTRQDALWSVAVCAEANMVNSFLPGLRDFLLSSDLYVKFLEEDRPHRDPQAIG